MGEKEKKTRYSDQEINQYRELEMYATLEWLKEKRLGRTFLTSRNFRNEDMGRKPLTMTSVANST